MKNKVFNGDDQQIVMQRRRPNAYEVFFDQPFANIILPLSIPSEKVVSLLNSMTEQGGDEKKVKKEQKKKNEKNKGKNIGKKEKLVRKTRKRKIS